MFDYWIFDINIWILDHLLIVRIFLFVFFCFIWCWIDFDSYNLGFLIRTGTAHIPRPEASGPPYSPDVLEKVWPAMHDPTKAPMTKRTQIIIMNTMRL